MVHQFCSFFSFYSVNFLWEAQNAKETRIWCCVHFGPTWVFGFRRVSGQRDQPVPHLLTGQSFPGDAAEEGMTLDVAHTSTSRTQAIASVKLEQLWSSTMEIQ